MSSFVALSFGALLGPGCATSKEGVEIIADSVRDFSGSQGASGWSYGYWDRGSDRDGVYDQSNDFRRLEHFGADPINGLSEHTEFDTGELWYLEDGRYYTSLWAEGGHPHGTMDLGTYTKAEHWVVRRWVSNVSGRVEVQGHAGKVMPWGENWAGDVQFRILVGGSSVYEGLFGDGGESYSVSATVKRGSPVDFLIGPGSAIGVMKFTGAIRATTGG